MLTLHIFDIGRGIDLLQSLDVVENDRIGCMGLSQGGTVALFSSAFDDRIKVTGVSGYLNSWKIFPFDKAYDGLCGSQIVPGLLEFGDHAEVTGLICPRPVFFEFGIKDPLFPITVSRTTYETVERIYKIAGAQNKLEVEEFNGVHEFRGIKIFDFFNKWL